MGTASMINSPCTADRAPVVQGGRGAVRAQASHSRSVGIVTVGVSGLQGTQHCGSEPAQVRTASGGQRPWPLGTTHDPYHLWVQEICHRARDIMKRRQMMTPSPRLSSTWGLLPHSRGTQDPSLLAATVGALVGTRTQSPGSRALGGRASDGARTAWRIAGVPAAEPRHRLQHLSPRPGLLPEQSHVLTNSRLEPKP